MAGERRRQFQGRTGESSRQVFVYVTRAPYSNIRNVFIGLIRSMDHVSVELHNKCGRFFKISLSTFHTNAF